MASDGCDQPSVRGWTRQVARSRMAGHITYGRSQCLSVRDLADRQDTGDEARRRKCPIRGCLTQVAPLPLHPANRRPRSAGRRLPLDAHTAPRRQPSDARIRNQRDHPCHTGCVGSYTLSLRVTDTRGAFADRTVTLLVNNTAPNPVVLINATIFHSANDDHAILAQTGSDAELATGVQYHLIVR